MNEIKVTKNSLDKANEIISTMESHSFHNHYHILYDICDLFGHDITYLEIGCFAGGSASLVSSHNSVRKVYSIDLGQPINKNIAIKNVEKYKNKNCFYKYFQGDSADLSLIELVYNEIKYVDILYIDGNHSYNGVISDFKNYEALLKPNGYLIFDDYLDSIYSPEVKTAVDFIVQNYINKNYSVIGSISYNLIKETNLPNFESNNLYILKKN